MGLTVPKSYATSIASHLALLLLLHFQYSTLTLVQVAELQKKDGRVWTIQRHFLNPISIHLLISAHLVFATASVPANDWTVTLSRRKRSRYDLGVFHALQ
ncbi:hypothetical protein EDD85DRAFT_214802 [Armillaria nabsnona]|nr:hypothetical protein EDD85DRAFT_214802 [Armillaria nabsnona]